MRKNIELYIDKEIIYYIIKEGITLRNYKNEEKLEENNPLLGGEEKKSHNKKPEEDKKENRSGKEKGQNRESMQELKEQIDKKSNKNQENSENQNKSDDRQIDKIVKDKEDKETINNNQEISEKQIDKNGNEYEEKREIENTPKEQDYKENYEINTLDEQNKEEGQEKYQNDKAKKLLEILTKEIEEEKDDINIRDYFNILGGKREGITIRRVNKTYQLTSDVKSNDIIDKLSVLIDYLADTRKELDVMITQEQQLNMKKLLFRKYEKKPIKSYYYYKMKDKVIIVIDTSGSMFWFSGTANILYKLAVGKDIVVYEAPNGIFTHKHLKGKIEEIDHDKTMKELKNTHYPIIYVGDYDGANTPIELSWKARVYWVCPEARYERFEEHNWVHYSEEDYKGFFGRALSIRGIIRVLQKFVENIARKYYWYEDWEYEEDEEGDDSYDG